MIRFYAPEIEETGTLPGIESGHCCRVLRMSEGDMIEVVDGRGFAYECKITRAHHKSTQLQILLKKEEPKHWHPRITLAVAPTKNIDRMEWMLEKCEEIGVDRIVFLKCKRSERKEIKDERLIKILVSAMKQSMKARMPEFSGMIDFRKFMEENQPETVKIVGYCADNVERHELVKEYRAGQDVVIMIGPEGDFTPDEIQLALDRGYIPSTFGNTRLRTETAALFALSAIHVINDLKKDE